jgi:GT2 family glycosyltransferase
VPGGAGNELPVTVVIPTIGRPALLRACLESLRRCTPRPSEVVVVDQGAADATRDICGAFGDLGTRHVPCRGDSIGAGMNHGLHEACHGVVCITNDDITVAPDWIEVAHAKVQAAPFALHTGRVLPVGQVDSVPAWIDDDQPRVHTSRAAVGALYAGNMACERDSLLRFGGFDPWIRPAAEDNDLCYRWLSAGRAVHYHPAMVCWHHDWRSPTALRAHFVGYARGDGLFWTKHLLQGDGFVVRFLVAEVWSASRVTLRGLKRERTYPHYGLGVLLRGLPLGVVEGLRRYAPWIRRAATRLTAC